MNKEKQRIAIAEACGWKRKTKKPVYWAWRKPSGQDGSVDDMPDYLNDLNAMHEAEVHTFTPIQMARYRDELIGVMAHVLGASWGPIFATAAQRAEAFLKTLDKWIETD